MTFSINAIFYYFKEEFAPESKHFGFYFGHQSIDSLLQFVIWRVIQAYVSFAFELFFVSLVFPAWSNHSNLLLPILL